MAKHTVGVCGFGRCGSTLVMRMLLAGGCPPVVGAEEPPHESNLDAVWRMGPDDLAGRSVKLLDAPRWNRSLPVAREWRFVWLDRDPMEQARSQVKFLMGVTGVPIPDAPAAVAKFAASYGRDRPGLMQLLRRHGTVFVLRYERVLDNPRRAARQLKQVWPGLDVEAAAAVVHNRDGKCRPDLSVELDLTAGKVVMAEVEKPAVEDVELVRLQIRAALIARIRLRRDHERRLLARRVRLNHYGRRW